jgi:hypothetical protein
MKPLPRNVLIGCFGVAVIVGGLILLARPYIWIGQAGAVVSVDGEPSDRAMVYRSDDGQLLVWFREPSPEGVYIIAPSHGVGRPNRSVFLLVCAYFALSTEKEIATVGLTNRVKNEIDPHLVTRQEYVEFTVGITSGVPRRVRVPL